MWVRIGYGLGRETDLEGIQIRKGYGLGRDKDLKGCRLGRVRVRK